MNPHRLIVLAVLFTPACIIPDPGDEVEGRFQVMGGARRLEDTRDLDAFEHSPTIGLSLGFGAAGQGPGIEMGVLYSTEDDDLLGSDSKSEIFEFFTGYRYDFDCGDLRPYAGLGLSYLGWALEADEPLDVDDRDDAFGGYATAGFDYFLNDTVTVGLRGRYFIGKEIGIDEFEVDPDFGELLLTLGFRY